MKNLVEKGETRQRIAEGRGEEEKIRERKRKKGKEGKWEGDEIARKIIGRTHAG